MKERPILFSGPMVRAILEGAKTQTRRVMKPQPDHCHVFDGTTIPIAKNDNPPRRGPTCSDIKIQCPYGQPGDRLWVREAWRVDFEGVVHYKADGLWENMGTWKPSIHMPRWASRITLEIVNVRVEQITSILPDDCYAEGLREGWNPEDPNGRYEMMGFTSSCEVECFSFAWDSINAKRGYSWDANPWVWVIEFKRIDS